MTEAFPRSEIEPHEPPGRQSGEAGGEDNMMPVVNDEKNGHTLAEEDFPVDVDAIRHVLSREVRIGGALLRVFESSVDGADGTLKPKSSASYKMAAAYKKTGRLPD